MPRAPSANGDTGGKCRSGVYDTLRARALNYRFKPGQHLPIAVIARLLKVSNTPVREALMRLYAEGLVDAVPHRGFFARELRLAEIAEYNIMLDVMVCRCLETVDMTRCIGGTGEPDDVLSKRRLKKRLTAFELTCGAERLFETIVLATGGEDKCNLHPSPGREDAPYPPARLRESPDRRQAAPWPGRSHRGVGPWGPCESSGRMCGVFASVCPGASPSG